MSDAKHKISIVNPISAFVAMFGIVEIALSVGLKWVPATYFIIYFIALICYTIFISVMFFYILIKKQHIFFGPRDFSDENNYMELNKKINKIETETLPMLMYMKLSEIGKRLCLISMDNEFNLEEFISKRNLNNRRNDIDVQLEILINRYHWLERKDNLIRASATGREAMMTFIDFCYARIAPNWWANLE